jgi:hypothetical protein
VGAWGGWCTRIIQKVSLLPTAVPFFVVDSLICHRKMSFVEQSEKRTGSC